MIIRRYRPEDFDPVNDLWRRARVDAYGEFHVRQGHTVEEDRRYFREVVQTRNDLWIGEIDERAAAFLAIAGDFIDQLFVAPEHQRRGVGAALLAHARGLSPSGLRLFTFQFNVNARAFYEKHGFVVTRLGVSPPPECEPDVEYHWRP